MLVFLVVSLIQAAPPVQQSAAPRSARDSIRAVRDSVRAVRDSTRGMHRPQKEPKRIPVTPEMLASAFRDAEAGPLLALARVARTRQDSALQAYDATTYQRISAGLGFAKFGRDRLAFRSEQSTKVKWRRDVGAYVDITGSRAVAPIAGKSANIRIDGDISPIPYYPGSETLWIGSEVQRTVDENKGVIHPLAEGSEAYYTYTTGDSATFRLPDGHPIRLRELKVRPRSPQWNLAVGSMWFDLDGGQLVRAAYRMSVPMDIKAQAEADDPTAFSDVPALVKPMLFPMTAQVSAIGVEYGLYQGRFWLPRVQVLEGDAQMSFMHVPMKLEQKYEYSNVNSGEKLAAIPALPDSLRRRGTSVNVSVGGESRRDSIRYANRTRTRRAQCDTAASGNFSYARISRDNSMPVLVSVPCDSTKLANSPDLPGSIFDKGEETFGSAEMDALVKDALSMTAQADFSPARPHAQLDNMRYNRIEALSVGGRLDQELGAGYSVHATGRIGIADREPNVEITGARSDLRHSIQVSAYNHLVSASDWGRPLSLGASISAFLFGRDEGFYYRASGLELSSVPEVSAGGGTTWSVFAEQQRTATQRTTFSLANAVNGAQFEPNFEAMRGVYAGARLRQINTIGLDPDGFRLFSDLRVEAAHGDTGSYGRAALDLTASTGIAGGAASVTLAGGSAVGTLPTQRYWFLGGSQTVRGQGPGRETGDAFWLARIELARGTALMRPTLFSDFGWAGDRHDWQKIGLPMSGVGAGFSVLDGLVRFDVARGLNPDRVWRVDTYVEARF
jgi:hypothetical protein